MKTTQLLKFYAAFAKKMYAQGRPPVVIVQALNRNNKNRAHFHLDGAKVMLNTDLIFDPALA